VLAEAYRAAVPLCASVVHDDKLLTTAAAVSGGLSIRKFTRRAGPAANVRLTTNGNTVALRSGSLQKLYSTHSPHRI